MERYLRQVCDAVIPPDDWYCTTCYNAQLAVVIIQGQGYQKSTDHQLRRLTSDLDTRRLASQPAKGPLLVTERFAAHALLNEGAVLLVTVHDVFQLQRGRA